MTETSINIKDYDPVETAIFRGDTSISLKGRTLSQELLSFPSRGYVIKVKRNIYDLLVVIAKKLPEPTRENCKHPNTLVWLNIWDRFFLMEDNPNRLPLFKAICRVHLAVLNGKMGWWARIPSVVRIGWWVLRKIFLIEHEHDHSYYGVRQDVILELWLDEVLAGNYKPRSLDYPAECWNVNPNVRGKGFKLIQYCYSQKRHGLPIDAEKIKEILI